MGMTRETSLRAERFYRVRKACVTLTHAVDASGLEREQMELIATWLSIRHHRFVVFSAPSNAGEGSDTKKMGQGWTGRMGGWADGLAAGA